MRIRNLYEEETGVSPVIAVILMVAITVILAAVIASFVLGIGGSLQQTAPTASFSVEQNDVTLRSNWGNFEYRNVNITHESGDEIKVENIAVFVDGEPAYGFVRGKNYPSDYTTGYQKRDGWTAPEDRAGEALEAGETMRVTIAFSEYEETGGEIGTHALIVDHTACCDHTIWFANNPNTNQEIKPANNPGPLLQSGEVVSIVWTANTGSSSILYEYEVK